MTTLRPSTPVTIPVMQLVFALITVGGAGFSVGAVYPRLLAVESATIEATKQIKDMQATQARAALALNHVATIVERMDLEQSRAHTR